ncbi:AGAP013459-PA-like protein [Anopheles sinensis]|uniref:AGAP013459-PA-like protein n=1 Tax=Anopheles sinensis TaxID=74873 RepID=A0A084WA39_ANOSI|nr:AGAP013459-PA-like protein [Anopheles sinensis]
MKPLTRSAIILCGAIFVANYCLEGVQGAAEDEKCQWNYECCEPDEASGQCKTLCPTPTIICPTEGSVQPPTKNSARKRKDLGATSTPRRCKHHDRCVAGGKETP